MMNDRRRLARKNRGKCCVRCFLLDPVARCTCMLLHSIFYAARRHTLISSYNELAEQKMATIQEKYDHDVHFNS